MDILKLDPTQKKKAATSVAAAFLNYPMFTHYFPDPNRRARCLPWYMEKTLNCAMRYGEVFVTHDFSGVMFILPPGHTRITNAQYIRNGFLFTPIVVGLRNYIKNDAAETFVADTHAQLMNGREHYYLWGLAVDPKTQRSGAGGSLLKILMDKADSENMPIYLETHDPENVAYYERFGFKLVHTATIPNQGVNIWCMCKEAH